MGHGAEQHWLKDQKAMDYGGTDSFKPLEGRFLEVRERVEFWHNRHFGVDQMYLLHSTGPCLLFVSLPLLSSLHHLTCLYIPSSSSLPILVQSQQSSCFPLLLRFTFSQPVSQLTHLIHFSQNHPFTEFHPISLFHLTFSPASTPFSTSKFSILLILRAYTIDL